jgi:SWI/SNF-related matrix-associated actin-dependent regulator of chromatin subfamily A-like protein 1
VTTATAVRIRISTERNFWVVESPPDPDIIGALRGITGRRWNGVERRNEIRRSPVGAAELHRFMRDFGGGQGRITVQAKQWIDDLLAQGLRIVAEREALADMSGAQDAQFEVPGLGGELRPFQRAGVAYVMRANRRAFIADDMGTGKSVQALAVLQAADAFPAIVVCPAAVKLHWRNHVRGPAIGAPKGWLPGRTVMVCRGREPKFELIQEKADVVVINYDVLVGWLPWLVTLGARALVLDESHKVKSPRADRTLAVKDLVKSIPGSGVVLALSGTPVLNRPEELITQLQVIGRMGDLGGERRYRQRYCGWDRRHLPELNARLKGCCWIRRTKAEVMPELPEKQIVRVPMDAAADVSYTATLAAVLGSLRDGREVEDEVTGERVTRSLTSMEELAELGRLRQEVGRIKLRSAVKWCKDFVEGSEEKLIIFAHHREFQAAFRDAFPGCAWIMGGMGDEPRQAQVDRFQTDPECRVIVCSLMAAREGITLTAASNVVFHEQDWTPATHDQAEDRANRMGQKGAVTAWYLLAEGTIDDMMADLIEEKRLVTSAVTDGEAKRRVSVSIASDVVRRLLAEAV